MNSPFSFEGEGGRGDEGRGKDQMSILYNHIQIPSFPELDDASQCFLIYLCKIMRKNIRIILFSFTKNENQYNDENFRLPMDNNSLSLVLLQSLGFTHRELRTYFLERENPQSPTAFFDTLSHETLKQILKEEKITKILQMRDTLDKKKIAHTLETKNIAIIDWNHPLYPESIKRVGHAPYFFTLRGTMQRDTQLLAVVWSRKHTNYAERILKNILPEIIDAGYGIVSGGAYGVDTLSHRITLEHGGYTIAVVGTGIDRAYPAENKSLFESIIEKWGAIISHFPLGMGPELYNFPIRNEIIAWLSKWVIIPEAWLSSGTLITAQLALEHGRDVFAVPWDIDRDTSKGANMLIATGQAKCTREANDILEEYGDFRSQREKWENILPKHFESDLQKSLYENIMKGVNTPDELGKCLNLDTSSILLELSMMEIGWLIHLNSIGEYSIH